MHGKQVQWYNIVHPVVKHVHNLLLDFCLTNNLISPYQFGFFSYCSTAFVLLFIINSFHQILQSNRSGCACFLDLRKAFDSVPHALLLRFLSIPLTVYLSFSAGSTLICMLVLSKLFFPAPSLPLFLQSLWSLEARS